MDVVIRGARPMRAGDLAIFGGLTRRKNSHLLAMLRASEIEPVECVLVAAEDPCRDYGDPRYLLGWAAAWLTPGEPPEACIGV